MEPSVTVAQQCVAQLQWLVSNNATCMHVFAAVGVCCDTKSGRETSTACQWHAIEQYWQLRLAIRCMKLSQRLGVQQLHARYLSCCQL